MEYKTKNGELYIKTCPSCGNDRWNLQISLKQENQGYDAFVPLVDSGISLYAWVNSKFFSIIIYTCKSFNEEVAREVTKQFFASDEIEALSF